MIEHWDEELLAQLRRCPSERAVLTTYPSSYTLPDDYEPGRPDAARLNPGTHPIVVCARDFGAADGFLWAAGLAFSVSAVVREVPYDPGLEDLFFGEEPSM